MVFTTIGVDDVSSLFSVPAATEKQSLETRLSKNPTRIISNLFKFVKRVLHCSKFFLLRLISVLQEFKKSLFLLKTH